MRRPTLLATLEAGPWLGVREMISDSMLALRGHLFVKMCGRRSREGQGLAQGHVAGPECSLDTHSLWVKGLILPAVSLACVASEGTLS